jgi:hypothetical protein
MTGRLTHTMHSTLAAVYLVAAVAGHLVTLQGLINSKGQSHQVTSSKKFHRFGSRPYWAVRKHLLSTPQEAKGPTMALFSHAESPERRAFAIFRIPNFTSLSVHPVFLSYRPRDPPLA